MDDMEGSSTSPAATAASPAPTRDSASKTKDRADSHGQAEHQSRAPGGQRNHDAAAPNNATFDAHAGPSSLSGQSAGHGAPSLSASSNNARDHIQPSSSSSSAAATAVAASATPPHFVTPADFLKPKIRQGPFTAARPSSSGPMPPQSPIDRDQVAGLRAIRRFLRVRTPYDVLPLSYRLIILDTSLLVKKSLNILNQCGIVSAPLWDSRTSTFAGLLTTSDYLNVVQYYWQNPDQLAQIDQFKLNSLREIERALGVTPIETVSIHPLRPLYEACVRMLQSRARRLPIVDVDDETQREMVVSVITQYRILKFVCVNVKETQMLRKPLKDLNVGTYTNLCTARMDTPAMDVIHMLVKRNISCVPVLDRDGTVLNVFEAVDVIALIKGGDYDNLNLSVGKALEKRSEFEKDFQGIYTCTLNDRMDTIFDTIRKSRVHRLVVIDEDKQLKGLLSLSDILDYALNSPLGDEGEEG